MTILIGILSFAYLIIITIADIVELSITNNLKIAKAGVFNILGDMLLWAFFINAIVQLYKMY